MNRQDDTQNSSNPTLNYAAAPAAIGRNKWWLLTVLGWILLIPGLLGVLYAIGTVILTYLTRGDRALAS